VRGADDPAGRDQVRQRLAESFEAALRLADGRAVALEMDSGREHLFNARFACPVCSYSISELEPRLFSFNSPAGACPTCDGLGTTDVFDAERVVAFPSLSLAGGAIKGWDRRNGYYFSLIESLARHYGFDVDAPFECLPAEARHAVLHGSGDEVIKFSYIMESGASQGRKITRKHAFEGILPNMARRYRETDSVVVREELARYRSTRPCPDCGGTRLRREARHVKVGDGAQSRAVGLDYLTLDRESGRCRAARRSASGWPPRSGPGLVGVLYVLDEPSIGLHQRDNEKLITDEGPARSGQHGGGGRARRADHPRGRLRDRPRARRGAAWRAS
jgi:excinuclease ABC subunit A